MNTNGYQSVQFFAKNKRSDTQWDISFLVPAGSAYFKEHFESFRLLPAVGEIDIVVRCIAEILKQPVGITAIKKTKFVKPIFPDARMRLVLDFCPDEKARFTFYNEAEEKASYGLVQYSV